MPRIAMTHSLMDYPKLRIASYKDQLTPFSVSMQTNYTYRGKAYNYEISLSRTPCHYGGYRHWFICPHCGKRVGVLYCAGLYVCRHCIGANYQTQLEQPLERVRRKKYKVGKKLYWWSGEIGKSFPMKPKGMHQKTFDRIWAEFKALEKQENNYLIANFVNFANRHNLDISGAFGE